MTKASIRREQRLRRVYGITQAQYLALFRLQVGVCAICEKAPKPGQRFHTDHDHTTGRVRGVLCYYCNRRRVGRLTAKDYHLTLRVAEYIISDRDGRTL